MWYFLCSKLQVGKAGLFTEQKLWSWFFTIPNFQKPYLIFFDVQMLYTHFSIVGSLKKITHTHNRLHDCLNKDTQFGEFIDQLRHGKKN